MYSEPGPDQNQVSAADRGQNLRQRADPPRNQLHALDTPARTGDFRFSRHHFSTVQFRLQRYILCGGGENSTANGQHARGQPHRLRKIPGNVGQRGEKQISKGVAAQAGPSGKAILKEAAEQVFVVRKRNHAVANVTGRKDAVFAP